MISEILITLLLSYLPLDGNVKMQLSMLISAFIHGDYHKRILNRFYTLFEGNHVTVTQTLKDNEKNQLFEKLESYISKKFASQLSSYELVPKNGDIEFNISDMLGKKFKDNIEIDNVNYEFDLSIKVVTRKSEHGHPIDDRAIVITSKTATSDVVKKYVKKVSSIHIKHAGVITVFRPIIEGKKKDEQTVEWERVNVRTTKTLQNTIYSQTIIKELFDDVDKFIANEKWYTDRGIPYKRGYFLHSTPGQGKTSAAKIIANAHDIPIFCLDLSTIKTNAVLLKLITQINYHVSEKDHYILLIEDFDKSSFIKTARYSDDDGGKISMDFLLNMLDGVDEPHGRILCMTANDKKIIEIHKALIRPGRTDKILELQNCDADQIHRMYDLFYNDLNYIVDWSKWKFADKLSAAYVIKILQENARDPEAFLNKIGVEVNPEEQLDIKTDETFAKICEDSNKDQFNTFHSHKKSRREPMSRLIKRKLKNEENNIEVYADTSKCYKEKSEKSKKEVEKLKEKLATQLEKERKKKEREKERAKKQRIKEKIKKMREMNGIAQEEQCEENEYDTPEFLLNQVAKAEVGDDIIAREVEDELEAMAKATITTTKMTTMMITKNNESENDSENVNDNESENDSESENDIDNKSNDNDNMNDNDDGESDNENNDVDDNDNKYNKSVNNEPDDDQNLKLLKINLEANLLTNQPSQLFVAPSIPIDLRGNWCGTVPGNDDSDVNSDVDSDVNNSSADIPRPIIPCKTRLRRRRKRRHA